MPERPAPTVEPARHFPGKFDVTLWWNKDHSFSAPLTHAELEVLEAQIAAILRPPAE